MARRVRHLLHQDRVGQPTIRNRHMAIRLLSAWSPDTVSDNEVAAVQQASMIETEPD